MSTQLVPTSRNLPALLIRKAEELGAIILATLDRLGFVHKNQDGTVFSVCFASAKLWGDRWVSFEVDVHRLWHFDVLSLASAGVKATLEAATRHDVFILTKPTLIYAVRLGDKPQTARLPSRVTLNLDARPADPLAVPVGQARDGAVWRSLHSLGHTLIMGASGTGKSTWLHCALAALITGAGPDLLQVVLIDPKQIELSIWGNAPHLRGPVVWSVEDVTKALAELADEMDRRGELLASIGARDLPGYNKRAATPLPYILAVVDEALDLTLQAGDSSQLVTLLKRLASKGRATGLYLWLAATHGTADVLPRVVSVNLSSRVAFRVQDGNAARLAGCPGAEKIARDKPGRLLARLDGEPLEMQGYHLADDALAAIAGNLSSKPAGPILSDQEQALVAWALAENDGYLSLEDVERAGWGHREARRLIGRWEHKKWLEKDPKAQNKRRVMRELGRAAGLDDAKLPSLPSLPN